MDGREACQPKAKAKLEEQEAMLPNAKAKLKGTAADAKLEMQEQIERVEKTLGAARRRFAELADASAVKKCSSRSS